MCAILEFVGRCGLSEFQANDRLRKSDSPVNTLSLRHNHELTTHKITEKHVCVCCRLAGFYNTVTSGRGEREGEKRRNVLVKKGRFSCKTDGSFSFTLPPPPPRLPSLHASEADISVQAGGRKLELIPEFLSS